MSNRVTLGEITDKIVEMAREKILSSDVVKGLHQDQNRLDERVARVESILYELLLNMRSLTGAELNSPCADRLCAFKGVHKNLYALADRCDTPIRDIDKLATGYGASEETVAAYYAELEDKQQAHVDKEAKKRGIDLADLEDVHQADFYKEAEKPPLNITDLAAGHGCLPAEPVNIDTDWLNARIDERIEERIEERVASVLRNVIAVTIQMAVESVDDSLLQDRILTALTAQADKLKPVDTDKPSE